MPRPRRGRKGGRGSGRGRGRGRGREVEMAGEVDWSGEVDWPGVGDQTVQPDKDEYQLNATKEEENKKDVNLPTLFTSEKSFEMHLSFQEKERMKYIATFLTLLKSGAEILQSSKARALAVAWARKDHELADAFLSNKKAFGLVEVLKAVTILDSGRKIREWEKRLKRLQMQPKPNAKKAAKIKTNINNLSVLKPSVGSLSGAISRHIQRWVRSISEDDLQYYALYYPIEPWKKLADLVHLNSKKDFKLPWFLPHCYGEPAPEGSLVAKCADLSEKTANEVIADADIPYARIKTLNADLTNESKERIARSEKTLDSLIWNYEDLTCPEVDRVISERLRSGEEVALPYGKIMERLLIIKQMRDEPLLILGDEVWGIDQTLGAIVPSSPGDDTAKEEETKELYEHLISLAQKQLEHTKLMIDSPVAVIGDRSGSMETAIKTSTIIASLLCAIAKAELCFFDNENLIPPEIPTTTEQVLKLASTLKTGGSTIPAASLLPYYEQKKVIKTFVMVTDEEENGQIQLDGTSYNFHELFKKYSDEVYPAKLVFVSFLYNQNVTGRMVKNLQSLGFYPLQFKLSNSRPDLAKLNNLLAMLSQEAVGFSDEVDELEKEIVADGLKKAMENLKLQN